MRPAIEHRDPVGQRQRLALVVGDVDERRAGLAVHAAQLDLHLQPDLEVERRERLVEQQHLGPVHERPRQRDALQLPAGQLVRAPPLVARPGAPGAAPRRTRVARSLRDTRCDAQAEGDVAGDVEVREQRRALEDHVHRPAVRRDARSRRAADATMLPARRAGRSRR